MRAAIDDTSAYRTELRLPDGVWTVDPQRSEVGFAARSMWGLQTVRGVFRTCEGSVRVRGDDVAGELTVDAASVDTGRAKRDSHLRSDAGTLRLEGRTIVSRTVTGMTWNWLRAIGRDAELHARLTLQRAAA